MVANVVSMAKHKSYLQIAQIHAGCIKRMQREQSIMKAFIVALTLTIITMGLGFILAMQKIKSEPMTVYIDGQRETVDINELPLAPLEEIKE